VRNPDINATLIRALSALHAGRHDEARRLLIEVLAADGNNQEAWRGLHSLADAMVEPQPVTAPKPDARASARALRAGGDSPRQPASAPPVGTCPHLGLRDDRHTSLLFADSMHRCYASDRPQPVDEEHQEAFCLASAHVACPRYVKPAARAAAAPLYLPDEADDDLGVEEEPPSGFSFGRVALWALVGVALVFIGLRYGPAFLSPPPTPTPDRPIGVVATLTQTPTATPLPTPTGPATAPLVFGQPTATPTPVPGGANYALSPRAEAVGWVVSSEERGNHFGDSHLYSGIYKDAIYHGAMQFDLSAIPRGAPIVSARLQLAGLNRDRLGTGGTWEVRVLTETVDYDWATLNYQAIHNAVVVQSLLPVLTDADLAVRRVSFTVETAPDGTNDLILRQLPLLISEKAETADQAIVLARDVRRFALEFLPRPGQVSGPRAGEWQAEWPLTNALPWVVRFTLAFGGARDRFGEPADLTVRTVLLPSLMVPGASSQGSAPVMPTPGVPPTNAPGATPAPPPGAPRVN